MKRRHLIAAICAMLEAVSLASAQGTAGSPENSRLVDRLSRLASTSLSESAESCAFVMEARGVNAFFPRAVLAWKAPDKLLFAFLDPKDSTPIAIVCGGKSLIYDPMNMMALSNDSGGLRAELKIAESQFNYVFTIPNKERDIDIDIDLAALAIAANGEVHCEEIDGGAHFVMTGTVPSGGKFNALITPASERPLDQMALFTKSNLEEPFVLCSIIDDASVHDESNYEFPETELSKLPIPTVKIDQKYSGLNFFFSTMVRAAIQDPSLRTDETFLTALGKHDQAAADTLRKADQAAWERVEQLDALVSAQLRNAMSGKLGWLKHASDYSKLMDESAIVHSAPADSTAGP